MKYPISVAGHARLCNVVFQTIRETHRAYVFISRDPVEFLVFGTRGDNEFAATAMDVRNFVFVGMYEQNAKASDVLADAVAAHKMVVSKPADSSPNLEPSQVVQSVPSIWRSALLLAAVAMLTWGSLRLLQLVGERWFFGG